MSLPFVEQNLQPLNTLGLAGRARVAVLEGEEQLPGLCSQVQGWQAAGGRLFVLGGGSNVVVAPHPRHQVLRVALRGIRLWRQTPTHWIVEAAAGEPWHPFVAYCLAQGWPGLENLALIPGTVGAAPVQNIGAYGVELADRLHSVLAWDLQAGERQELSVAQCGLAYRDSLFKRSGAGRWLIVRVRFTLARAWQPHLEYADLRHHPLLQPFTGHQAAGAVAGVTPQQVFDAVCEVRRRKLPDPAIVGNAGSFFKNPVMSAQRAQALRARHPGLPTFVQPDGRVKLAAGWLIEQAGWKGRRLGPVGMHARQALVLVNHGGAQATDVQNLAQAVRDDVMRRFGVGLEREPVDLD